MMETRQSGRTAVLWSLSVLSDGRPNTEQWGEPSPQRAASLSNALSQKAGRATSLAALIQGLTKSPDTGLFHTRLLTRRFQSTDSRQLQPEVTPDRTKPKYPDTIKTRLKCLASAELTQLSRTTIVLRLQGTVGKGRD